MLNSDESLSRMVVVARLSISETLGESPVVLLGLAIETSKASGPSTNASSIVANETLSGSIGPLPSLVKLRLVPSQVNEPLLVGLPL